MKWLKLHTEARNDPKLESLPDDQFRVWFRLLCFAGDQDERGVIEWHNEKVFAIQVAHGDVALLRATLVALEELDILECTTDVVCFVHWDTRQYEKPSNAPDRVAERVRQHRQRQSNAPLPIINTSNTDVTPSNAPVTPLVTPEQIRSDTEQIQNIKNDSLPAEAGDLADAAKEPETNVRPVRSQPKPEQAAKFDYKRLWAIITSDLGYAPDFSYDQETRAVRSLLNKHPEATPEMFAGFLRYKRQTFRGDPHGEVTFTQFGKDMAGWLHAGMPAGPPTAVSRSNGATNGAGPALSDKEIIAQRVARSAAIFANDPLPGSAFADGEIPESSAEIRARMRNGASP